MNKKMLAIAIAAVLFINCQTTTSTPYQKVEEEITQKAKAASTACSENNTSDECQLRLTSIDVELLDDPCEPYDQIMVVNTEFFAPAGLNEGSITRLDWEFLPNGNAGFWISNIDAVVPKNSSGTIEMSGCFTFGEQDTLQVTRVIIDDFGNRSNELVMKIPRSSKSKVMTHTVSGFEVRATYFGE